MTSIAVNTDTAILDLKTGKLTRDGFLLFSSVVRAVNDATSPFTTVDGTETLTNKTIAGYTKTVDLAPLLIVDTVTSGVTKAASSDAVFGALGSYTPTTSLPALLIEDAINDAEVTKAPTENAVFDALALKQAISTWTGKTLLIGTATYDPASLADGAGATTTVTVTGAALGNMAIASFSHDLQGITLTAYASAADTVSVRFQNESGGTLDLASGTLTAWVIA